jgi:4-diphosphocytidyl-2-C-methyl-D-erythritol kinase
MPRAVRVRSYAKVNLGLEVLGQRDDGYHELRTLFQTIDLHDELTLRPRARGVSVECDHPLVPRDRSNLAARAAEELQAYGRIGTGVEIALEKRIPVGGGLGGGSSNAAAVLLGLDRMWRLGLGPAGLHPLARGDEVYPLRRQIRGWVVLVDPGLPVSTPRVFARIDSSLTPRENSTSIFHFVSRELQGAGGYRFLVNDLEEAAMEEAPALRERVARVRDVLRGEGALVAALSGSGSSFFGLFGGAREARRAGAALEAQGFPALVVRTLTLDQYGKAWSSPRAR